MIEQKELDRESDARNAPWRVVFGLITVLVFAALPESRIQDELKMSVWSAGFLGFVLVYVWPFLFDLVSRAVVAGIALFHFIVMWFTYPHIPHHGYLGIGLTATGEFIICLIPIAWLDKRSEDVRAMNNEAT
jgi:hypothetical protein